MVVDQCILRHVRFTSTGAFQYLVVQYTPFCFEFRPEGFDSQHRATYVDGDVSTDGFPGGVPTLHPVQHAPQHQLPQRRQHCDNHDLARLLVALRRLIRLLRQDLGVRPKARQAGGRGAETL